MRYLAARLFKKWLLRQLTFAPLIVFLAVGFRSGFATMTPEARWHPAFKPAGPLAAVVLLALWRRKLPFDPMALGMLLFIAVGAVGIVALGYGYDAIHVIYAPMAQAMMFVWIALVFLVLAIARPVKLLELPHDGPRVHLGAWLLVVLSVFATGLSYLMRQHEALAGLIPFLMLIAARALTKKWVQGGQLHSQNSTH